MPCTPHPLIILTVQQFHQECSFKSLSPGLYTWKRLCTTCFNFLFSCFLCLLFVLCLLCLHKYQGKPRLKRKVSCKPTLKPYIFYHSNSAERVVELPVSLDIEFVYFGEVHFSTFQVTFSYLLLRKDLIDYKLFVQWL